MTPESIEKFLAMHERIEANNARKAYHAAVAEFKRTCPKIVRRSENQQFSVVRNGVKRASRFASREDIDAAIVPALAAVGLSYRFGDMRIENGEMIIACIVSHADGHSETSTVAGVKINSPAGSSDLQKLGAAQTYAMRYAVIQALGLSSVDEDLDGNEEEDATPINESQRADIEITLSETKADVAAFLKWAGVERIKDIRAARYPAIMATLNRKRTGAK